MITRERALEKGYNSYQIPQDHKWRPYENVSVCCDVPERHWRVVHLGGAYPDSDHYCTCGKWMRSRDN